MDKLTDLLPSISSCELCKDSLPLGPRPVFQLHPDARILICGQAPGKKVHESGIPFDDQSGDRLREWMGVSRDTFYDAKSIGILPMGFCYPGSGKSGDLPPRPECAQTWHSDIMKLLSKVQLILVIGQYAQAYHLQDNYTTLTKRVAAWREFWPQKIPLPHPSPRNNIWLRKNPWFETELLPELRTAIDNILTK